MRVALIGNYAPDRQESMLRYAEMLREGLEEAGHEVRLALPHPVLNARHRTHGVWKWAGYLDKYFFGTAEMARAIRHADIVHVCDHSNAVYVPGGLHVPYVVTCHDLLAVRGALGEETDCPASPSGRFLQAEILKGLKRAQAVACVSQATLRDAERLFGRYDGRLLVAPNGLNHPYRVLPRAVVRERMAAVTGLRSGEPYILHVGSNLRRKNRETVVRTVAGMGQRWPGKLVVAGQPLNEELRQMAMQAGIADRLVEVAKPDNDLLEALYNGARALLFPSRFEGFGWPLVEAQASGCPVICSDREPFPEVTGGAALVADAEDHASFGEHFLSLENSPRLRDDLVDRGLANAARYGRKTMVGRFVSLYDQLLSQL